MRSPNRKRTSRMGPQATAPGTQPRPERHAAGAEPSSSISVAPSHDARSPTAPATGRPDSRVVRTRVRRARPARAAAGSPGPSRGRRARRTGRRRAPASSSSRSAVRPWGRRSPSGREIEQQLRRARSAIRLSNGDSIVVRGSHRPRSIRSSSGMSSPCTYHVPGIGAPSCSTTTRSTRPVRSNSRARDAARVPIPREVRLDVLRRPDPESAEGPVDGPASDLEVGQALARSVGGSTRSVRSQRFWIPSRPATMTLPEAHRNPSIRSTLRSFVQPLERHDSPVRPPEIRRASTGPSRRTCASTERLSFALAAIQSRRGGGSTPTRRLVGTAACTRRGSGDPRRGRPRPRAPSTRRPSGRATAGGPGASGRTPRPGCRAPAAGSGPRPRSDRAARTGSSG